MAAEAPDPGGWPQVRVWHDGCRFERRPGEPVGARLARGWIIPPVPPPPATPGAVFLEPGEVWWLWCGCGCRLAPEVIVQLVIEDGTVTP